MDRGEQSLSHTIYGWTKSAHNCTCADLILSSLARGSCKTWTGLESGLDYGLDSGLDWTRGGMGAATLAIDYFINRDREVLVLWLQVSRSPGCCVICRCRSGYTRLGAVGVASAV